MLPKFSIAFSRRTMTPRSAIRWAPRDSVRLSIAGSSSGARPTARAMANSSASTGGLAPNTLMANTTSTSTSITFVSSCPNCRIPSSKPVSGGRSDSRPAICPYAVFVPVATTTARPVPLRMLVPRKTTLVRSASPQAAPTAPARFSAG